MWKLWKTRNKALKINVSIVHNFVHDLEHTYTQFEVRHNPRGIKLH